MTYLDSQQGKYKVQRFGRLVGYFKVDHESTFQAAEGLRRLQKVIICRLFSWRVSYSVGFNRLSLPFDHRKLHSEIFNQNTSPKNEISVKVFDILYFILYFNFYFQIFLSTLFSVYINTNTSTVQLPDSPPTPYSL